MTDYMAQMLDELMGASRNACSGDEKIGFDHRDVCKDFLAGFCPNDLFRNTKADLGYCTLRHDENLKEEYKKSSRFGKMGYETDFMDRIRGLDRDVARRIEKNMRRLEMEKRDADVVGRHREMEDQKRREMTQTIEEKHKEAQKQGEEGNVSAAEALIREAEELEAERDKMIAEHEEKMKKIEATANELAKPMQVCQVCGCFMLVNDAQQRVDDHLMGKMHMAYARIKSTIEEYDQKKEEEHKKRIEEHRLKDEEREKERKREKERREKERERKRSRSRDRRRDRSRDRDGRRSDRDRRDRSRDRGDRRDRDRKRR